MVCCRRGANICSCCIKCLLHLAISRMGSQVVGKVKAFRKLEPIRTIFSLIGQDFAREFTFRECKAKCQPIHTVCASCLSNMASLIPSRLFLRLLSNARYQDQKSWGGRRCLRLAATRMRVVRNRLSSEQSKTWDWLQMDAREKQV